MIGKILGFAVVGLAIGCGGSVYRSPAVEDSDSMDAATNDAASPDARAHDAQSTDAEGPYPCGTTVCEGTDVCVHPCCGGALPACTPLLDGGQCAPGDTYESACNGVGGPGPGCRPRPCTPPPAYCAPKSSPTMCGPSQPGSRDVSCACG